MKNKNSPLWSPKGTGKTEQNPKMNSTTKNSLLLRTVEIIKTEDGASQGPDFEIGIIEHQPPAEPKG